MCPISDGVSYEPIPMNYDNVLSVKSRICKAGIRMCLEQQNANSKWVIDFRNPRIIDIMNEFTDDIFDSLMDMSSPYNSTNTVGALVDSLFDMRIDESKEKSYTLKTVLTEEELWNMCCADSMTEHSPAEVHIGRVMSFYTFELLSEYLAPEEQIRNYMKTLSLYPDDYIYSENDYSYITPPNYCYGYNQYNEENNL